MSKRASGKSRRPTDSRRRAGFQLKKATPYYAELTRAQSLERAGDAEQAAAIYMQILAQQPEHKPAAYLLGLLCYRGGRVGKALTLLQQAHDAYPDDVELLVALGDSLRISGRAALAFEILNRAIQIKPHSAPAQMNLGRVLADLNKLDEAIAHYQRALELTPSLAEAHVHLAYAWRSLGEPAEAEHSFRRALALAPHYAEAHRGLAGVKRFERGDDADITAMENLVQNPELPDAGRTLLHFSLGKVWDDLGDSDRAFQHFLEGNRLHRASYSYSTAQQVELFARQVAAYSKVGIARLEQAATHSRAPIFIVGMPRSGTSLVEQILASHHQVHGAGEIPHTRIFADGVQSLARLQFPEGLAFVQPRDLRAMGETYLEKLREYSDKPFVTDKLPHNFLRVPLLAAVFPNATIIHCRRNALDTCVSIFKHYFSAAHGYASDLGELGEYYRLYEQMMTHWQQLLPGRMIEVEYEQLVADPEVQIPQLLARCGLPFDPNCLNFHTTRRVVNTPSALQVRAPMHQRAVAQWQRYADYLEPLQSALAAAAPDLAPLSGKS
ncbi:MAG TPA: sulfotransferase [Spongiibacteraceae bacterium]|nr:sulfotransferase [Spongiibacteraceae bacterium]